MTLFLPMLPPTIIFDFFRPKQANPITNGIKERFDEIINQTCRQLTITLYVSFFYLLLENFLFPLCVIS